MKTLKFIGIAIGTILFCVNFSACSKEVEPQYELVTGEKKITRLEINSSDFGYSLWDFKYDNAGKLLKVIHNNGEYTQEHDYVWNNDAIISPYGVASLNDGLIRNYNSYYDVRYNDGRLVEITDLTTSKYAYRFSWLSSGEFYSRGVYDGGTQGYLTESFRFIYDSDMPTIKTNGFNPIIPYVLSSGFYENPLCVAHPELIGGRTDILPTHFSKTYYWFDENDCNVSETINGICNYKFDGEGYITECNMCSDDGNEFGFEEKYTIVWN